MRAEVPHNRPTLNQKELRASRRVVKSGWIGQGERVIEFENMFCEYIGVSHGHAVAVSSGSAALFLAILALEGKGQKIGLPVYTCAAVNNAVTLASGNSILIDNNMLGPNLDINIANQASLHTLIAVSTFGIPVSIPTKRSYNVIEDISQALGAEVNSQKIGLRGEVGICSLSATKLITSGGQGGMVFSTNKRLVDFVRDYRDFDARDDRVARFNFQMTDIQAAIGMVQLAKLPKFLQKREAIFEIYSKSGLDLIMEAESHHSPSRYRAVIRNTAPKKIQENLLQKGIRTIIPFTCEELLSTSSTAKNSVNLSKSTLSLPIYPSLTKRQAKKIAATVKSEIEKL
jgi:perosamine synthetase